jgi:hypothetical protein
MKPQLATSLGTSFSVRRYTLTIPQPYLKATMILSIKDIFTQENLNRQKYFVEVSRQRQSIPENGEIPLPRDRCYDKIAGNYSVRKHEDLESNGKCIDYLSYNYN